MAPCHRSTAWIWTSANRNCCTAEDERPLIFAHWLQHFRELPRRAARWLLRNKHMGLSKLLIAQVCRMQNCVKHARLSGTRCFDHTGFCLSDKKWAARQAHINPCRDESRHSHSEACLRLHNLLDDLGYDISVRVNLSLLCVLVVGTGSNCTIDFGSGVLFKFQSFGVWGGPCQ